MAAQLITRPKTALRPARPKTARGPPRPKSSTGVPLYRKDGNDEDQYEIIKQKPKKQDTAPDITRAYTYPKLSLEDFPAWRPKTPRISPRNAWSINKPTDPPRTIRTHNKPSVGSGQIAVRKQEDWGKFSQEMKMYLPRNFRFLLKEPEVVEKLTTRLMKDPEWLANLEQHLNDLVMTYLRIVRNARVSSPKNDGKREEVRLACVNRKKGGFDIVKLPVVKKWQDESIPAQKLDLGVPKVAEKCKNMFLIGTSKSGKSTLIDSMVNYILKVQWEDKFRVRISADSGGQPCIQAYGIPPTNDTKLHYNLNVVDCPVVSGGAKAGSDKWMKKFKSFMQKYEEHGVDSIHTICFIHKASDANVCKMYKGIYDVFVKQFGDVMRNMVCNIFTFCQTVDEITSFVEALAGEGFPCQNNFVFDNEGLFNAVKQSDIENAQKAESAEKEAIEAAEKAAREAGLEDETMDNNVTDQGESNETDNGDNDSHGSVGGGNGNEDTDSNEMEVMESEGSGRPNMVDASVQTQSDNQEEMLPGEKTNKPNHEDVQTSNALYFKKMWDTNQENFIKLFDAIENVKPVSLYFNVDKLAQREALADSINHLRVLIQGNSQTLQRLDTEKRLLKERQKEIECNKDFSYEVYEAEKIKRELPHCGDNVTNCSICYTTCHQNCAIAKDEDKKGCAAMSNGFCTVCKGKCKWDKHYNRVFVFYLRIGKKEKLFSKLCREYKAEPSEISSAVQADYKETEEVLKQTIGRSVQGVNSLNKICSGGKSDKVSRNEFIDMVIHEELREGTPGWKERIDILRQMKGKGKVTVKLKGVNAPGKVISK